jgi:hypothetical protein
MLILNSLMSGAVFRNFLGCRNSRQSYRGVCAGAQTQSFPGAPHRLELVTWRLISVAVALPDGLVRCLSFKSRASSDTCCSVVARMLGSERPSRR